MKMIALYFALSENRGMMNVSLKNNIADIRFIPLDHVMMNVSLIYDIK